MKKFVLVYRGAVQPDDGSQHMQDWMAWVHGLGTAMLDPGLPVMASKTVSTTGVHDTESDDPVAGISILQAADFEAALAMVKPCPHLSIGGTIEVAEAMDMPMA
ncbi:hypothetical protein [Marinicella meishanensis]|uniref:hypothetical protein n=1 Tax=Marinicella meishanensis TaxID=2873263 RepID=UPI001CBCBD3B|nr:hypothetical protein [Marinicella sp. NBU2979]